jgi:hypothetical protein
MGKLGPVRGSSEPEGGVHPDAPRPSEPIAWQGQGTHRYFLDGDLVTFELHGLFTVEDALSMLRISDAQHQQYGYVLFLFDARDGLNMSQEARRLVGDKLRSQPANRVTAIVGASVAIRTVTRLIQNASRLFGIPARPVQFCNTQEEALTWLDVHRQQFLARLRRGAAYQSGDSIKP